jgi:hypothetical protein
MSNLGTDICSFFLQRESGLKREFAKWRSTVSTAFNADLYNRPKKKQSVVFTHENAGHVIMAGHPQMS